MNEKKIKVLVVDDQYENVMLIKAIIENPSENKKIEKITVELEMLLRK